MADQRSTWRESRTQPDSFRRKGRGIQKVPVLQEPFGFCQHDASMLFVVGVITCLIISSLSLLSLLSSSISIRALVIKVKAAIFEL